MNDPRSDEHKYPEGDMNAKPTRPFYVDTDLSHYVVREQATGKSLTKRCTFDEADHACNLLNYGWRACQKQATEEMNSQRRSDPVGNDPARGCPLTHPPAPSPRRGGIERKE